MLQEIAVMIKEAGGEVTRLDGSLLYSNRITEWVGESEQQEDLLRQLEDILTKYAGKQRPNPYYALLMADGDNMGKTIDHQKEIKAHQDLSFVLSEFSERVSQIVKQNKGVPMYVGGDDILAYLPLHSVLDCAGQLEKEFQKRLSRYHFEGNGEKRSPTLSAGIVVAHHLTPLSSVLELVREAEKAAKAVEGKNALVVTLSKRGGYPRTISGKWGSISGRLFQLIAFHLQKSISKGTAYELRDLHRTLSPSSVGKKAIAQEALRIIKRKQEEGGEKAVSEKVISQFHEWIMDDEVSVGNLAREMVVAQEFAGIYGIEQAEMISEFIEE
jgi:CRISPR-associated protein Cmr2